MARLSAILFDLDGTLVASEPQSVEALMLVLKDELGITADKRDQDVVYGQSWEAIYGHLKERYGLPMSRGEMIERTTARRLDVFERHPPEIMPGVVDFLGQVTDLPTAIVTGSAHSEAHQLVPFLKPHEFRHVITSDDYQRSKPSPEGYQLAAERLGVDPQECLVFEDSGPGVASGLAAGAKVIALSAGNVAGHDQSAAHRVLQDFTQVTLDVVQELMSES